MRMNLKILLVSLFLFTCVGTSAFAHGDPSTHEHSHPVLTLVENINIDLVQNDDNIAVSDEVFSEEVNEDLLKDAADGENNSKK